MNDDAVAPVIAVMLILAAVVTVFAVFNGIYVPSLKQAAETEHLRNVEASFQKFSSDIDQAVSSRENALALSEPVQLGGGDIFLNTLRSGGSIAIKEEDTPACYLILSTGDGLVMRNGTMVNISYHSVGNFWQDQGYRWQYGYLNVTKYENRQAPVSYATMGDVNKGFTGNGSLAVFAGSFSDIRYTRNQTLLQNTTPTADNRFFFSPQENVCSGIVLRLVNMSASPDLPFASGNGFGTLQLKTRVFPEEFYGVNSITLVSGGKPFGNATVRIWNESFSALAGICRNNVGYNPDPGWSGDGYSTYTISQQVSPVNVTLNTVSLEIGVR